MSQPRKHYSNMNSSPFAQAVAMGYGELPIIPLRPASKIPFIKDWTRYCKEIPTSQDIEDWSNIDKANVGLALGEVSGIIALDFDHDVDGIHGEIFRIIPISPVRKVGARGFTMFYKYNGESPHKWASKGQMVVELLSTGNHTVLPPSVHPDGPVYRYSSILPLIGNVGRLQTLPIDFMDKVNTLLDIRSDHKDRVGSDNPDISEVSDALEFIDPEDYEVWLKVGMAMRDAYGVDGFPVWADWSKRSDKCVPTELLPKWNSFKKSGVGISTIFYYAKNNGYNKVEETPERDILIDINSVKDTIKQWRLYGKPVGESYGWESMDRLLHIRKGEFTIVTGYTNQGKSEFMDAVSINLMKNLGWSVGMISMEKCKENHVVQLMHSLSGKPIDRMSDEEVEAAYKIIEAQALVVDHLNIGKDIATLEKVIRFLAAERKADVVVIDPFNYIETTDDALYTHVINVAKKCTNLAKELNIHIFLVAHAKDAQYDKDGNIQKPRLYSIFGGTQFSNLVDNLIGVTRRDTSVKIETLKVRDQDQDSYGTITLHFNKETRGYYEDKDHKF